MELNYENIKKMLEDDPWNICGRTEDGEFICFGYEPEYDAFTAEFVSKQTKRGEWWCKMYYYENGTVEETYYLVRNPLEDAKEELKLAISKRDVDDAILASRCENFLAAYNNKTHKATA